MAHDPQYRAPQVFILRVEERGELFFAQRVPIHLVQGNQCGLADPRVGVIERPVQRLLRTEVNQGVD